MLRIDNLVAKTGSYFSSEFGVKAKRRLQTKRRILNTYVQWAYEAENEIEKKRCFEILTDADPEMYVIFDQIINC